MIDKEKVINDLQDAVNDDWLWRHADYYALTMERAITLLKEDCHNCKLECLLQKYDELKEKYDALLKEWEAKTGHWIIIEYDTLTCSCCGKFYYTGCDSTKEATANLEKGNVYRYCPYCGAKMEGR